MSEETDRLMAELKEIIDERQSLMGVTDKTASERLARQSRIVELGKEISRRRKELDELW